MKVIFPPRPIGRRSLVGAIAAGVACRVSPAIAQPSRSVIATFSVVRDLVQSIGGGRWQIDELIASGGDAHVYSATPADAIRLQRADLLVSNGLGFETWLPRLTSAAQFRGREAVASAGIEPLMRAASAHAMTRTPDPHCWHDVTLVRRYAANIGQALGDADASGAADYRRRLGEIDGALVRLDTWVREEVGRVPAPKRRVVCGHDAFAYLARAYGVEVFALQGPDHDHAPNARELARLVTRVRDRQVKAVFAVHHGNRALVDQVARDSGGFVAGVLYGDSLSPANGPAATYEAMIRYNVSALVSGMLRN